MLTIVSAESDDGSEAPGEIARVLEAMRKLEPLGNPEIVASDLDSWEGKLNRHEIYRSDEDTDATGAVIHP